MSRQILRVWCLAAIAFAARADNDGGGFANHLDIEAGTTVSQFIGKHLSGHDPADFLIRVNRQKQHLLCHGLSEHYRHIFQLTRLDDAIRIYNTEGDAVAAANKL